MPAEWEIHERTWMAWPSAAYTLGSDPVETDSDIAMIAWATWAAVANAIICFEPVTMLCQIDKLESAKKMLDPRVELVLAELNDAWMRDIGPTFVKNCMGEVAGVSWVFNGWGEQSWASWDKDAVISDIIIEMAAVKRISSKLINEGGGFHVNGEGVVLLTDTVQLGEGRNSYLTRAAVEEEIHSKLGTTAAIWLPRGLTRDYDEYGTRGHVDIVACFATPKTIFFHDQQNPDHPDYFVSREVRKILEEAGEFEVIGIPAPKIIRDKSGVVDYSYINFYLVNGGVIMCAFNDANDEIAKNIFESVYPDRKIVLIDATELFARGGGIHCITQQQPR